MDNILFAAAICILLRFLSIEIDKTADTFIYSNLLLVLRLQICYNLKNTLHSFLQNQNFLLPHYNTTRIFLISCALQVCWKICYIQYVESFFFYKFQIYVSIIHSRLRFKVVQILESVFFPFTRPLNMTLSIVVLKLFKRMIQFALLYCYFNCIL